MKQAAERLGISVSLCYAACVRKSACRIAGSGARGGGAALSSGRKTFWSLKNRRESRWRAGHEALLSTGGRAGEMPSSGAKKLNRSASVGGAAGG